MIKIHFLILLNIIIVIFCGCGKNLHKSSDLKHNNHIAHENNIKTASLSVDSGSLAAQSSSGNRAVAGVGDYKEPESTSCLKESFTTGSGSNASENIQIFLDEALDYCQVSQDFWQKGELENAVESLDQAYSLILSINTDETPRLSSKRMIFAS